jgi:hypothetical protein
MANSSRKVIHELKTVGVMTLLQFLIYSLSVYGWRMVYTHNVLGAVGIDIIYSTMQFLMVYKISTKLQKQDTIFAWVGIVIGAAAGTVIGMRI